MNFTIISILIFIFSKSFVVAKKSRCSAGVISLGYECCDIPCTVLYTDRDGDWGAQNDEWCGCGGDFTSNIFDCSPNFYLNGYNCCFECGEVVKEDEIGKYSMEYGKLCGVPERCLVQIDRE